MSPQKHDLRSTLFLLFLLTGLVWLAFPVKGAQAEAKGTKAKAERKTTTKATKAAKAAKAVKSTKAAKAARGAGIAKATPPCLVIRPGKGLGEVSLGMGMKALQAIQKRHKYSLTREGEFNPHGALHVYNMGPYRILLKGKGKTGKVSFVDMNFTNKSTCFQLGTKRMHPQGSWFTLAAQLGTCSAMEMRRGGSVIKCANQGITLITSRAPGFRVFVEAKKPVKSSKPICAGYIIKGGFVATAKGLRKATKARPARLSLQPGKYYCYNRLVVNDKTKPKQIPTMGQCETYPRRGATIVFCNHAGLAFVFGGPHLILSVVDVYHDSALPLPTGYPPRFPSQRR